jgi:Zn-dependent metalloprotease
VSASLVCLGCLIPLRATAQGHPTVLAVSRDSAGEFRAWDTQIDQMVRSRELRVREVQRDPLLPDRRHERLDQYHRGVRIVGGDIARQIAGDGTVSIFGSIHGGIDLDVTPRLSTDAARIVLANAVGGNPFGDVELVVLPLSDGYHLAYAGQATTELEIVNVFVDANTGALLRQYSDFLNEVGKGKGTYGDDKKVSVKAMSGMFVTDDGLRPAAITTYDMKGNLSRTVDILNRVTSVTSADIASNTDNNWTDSTVVDAHVYAGWYYDYLFKRFGRRGLDDQNLRMAVFTHPVKLADIASAPPGVVGLYYVNAFACATCGPNGRGAIVLGEGAPKGFLGNFEVKSFAAALDVVAHELTHTVTANTARLTGFPFSEGGALNEAFSDMFGIATAFYFEAAGDGPLKASYLIGRDLAVPSGVLTRSLANPAQTNDPDHYTRRIIGGDPHYNSTIASHAYYLAIEGGTNRTSGLSVQGVGAANREQIEKVFFRALTSLMPSNATFALTRAATIQAARDLYGAGGAVERAVTQAWDAVGVQPRVAPTAALLPSPAAAISAPCGGVTPSWRLFLTVSAGASNLRITQWQFEDFDNLGRSLGVQALSATNFAQFFNQCGPGSSGIQAQSDVCSAICTALEGGRTSGSVQASFTAIDDEGRTLTFSAPRATLLPPR